MHSLMNSSMNPEICNSENSSNPKKRKTSDNPLVSCPPNKKRITADISSTSSNEPVDFFKLRVLTDEQRELEAQTGVSTELKLYSDPWRIKKTLTESDVGHLSRIIIGKDLVDSHILRFSSKREFIDRVESREGFPVWVRDNDTETVYELKFKKWLRGRSYILNENWRKEFVKRRMLRKDDEIRLLWDPYNHEFHFKVLKRAA